MKKLMIWCILKYKKHISPHMPKSCRFEPTCSMYTVQALQIHGVFKGSLLGIWRIMRCNPFGKVGYDPPPEKGKWINPNRQLWRE